MNGTHLHHYEILRVLGSGSMGTVYLAQDHKLDRKVALKLLPPELVADGVRRRRFDRESRALAALNHPNIVTVHSVEEVDGQPFIVMEWVQGETLQDLIPPGGFAVERALELAIPIADGVAQAHAAGIVHRDLKPSNVMVRDDGVVKVLDFGISKSELETVVDGAAPAADLTAEGWVLGTFPYMSPQQILGMRVDSRSDVFSLGVILFEMLAGVRPFHGEGRASLAAAILQQPAPPLERIAAVPPEVDRLVQRCLEKEPPDRYASARELRDALLELKRRELRQLSGSAELPVAPQPPPPPTLLSSAVAESLPAAAPGGRRLRLPAILAGGAAVALLVGAAALWHRPPSPREAAPPAAATSPAGVAIAVLPLRNLSGNAAEDYFSDGTTEAVIANLARIGSLRVTSRDSVMRYRASAKPLATIARELGVTWLVEGSVQRTGQQVMMVVQLVEPATGTVRWGDTFQGPLSDIFLFQRQAAESVARHAGGRLSPTDRSRLAQVREVDGTAYESYLKARYLMNKRTPEALLQALEELDRALARDPGYALAWSARAVCYCNLGSFAYAVYPPRQTIPKAEQAARRAVELDDTLPEAHAALAMTLVQKWRWEEAEREFKTALELNPSNADVSAKYARYLIVVGRGRESIEMARRARLLDPLSPIVTYLEGTAYYCTGDYDRALAVTRTGLELQDFWLYHMLAGDAYTRKGRFAEAYAELRKAEALEKRNPFVLGALGALLARWGKEPEARAILAELEQRSTREYVAPTLLAKVHFSLGEPDPGFALLEKAYTERDQSLSFLEIDIGYENVLGDPRYREMVRRLGL